MEITHCFFTPDNSYFLCSRAQLIGAVVILLFRLQFILFAVYSRRSFHAIPFVKPTLGAWFLAVGDVRSSQINCRLEAIPSIRVYKWVGSMAACRLNSKWCVQWPHFTQNTMELINLPVIVVDRSQSVCVCVCGGRGRANRLRMPNQSHTNYRQILRRIH